MEKNEISLTNGLIVNVVTKNDTGWWLVENTTTKKSGWVPAEYITHKYYDLLTY